MDVASSKFEAVQVRSVGVWESGGLMDRDIDEGLGRGQEFDSLDVGTVISISSGASSLLTTCIGEELRHFQCMRLECRRIWRIILPPPLYHCN